MWNIIIGIAMIIGGFSGEFVLIGTESGLALTGLGVVLLIWGIVQLARGGATAKAGGRAGDRAGSSRGRARRRRR